MISISWASRAFGVFLLAWYFADAANNSTNSTTPSPEFSVAPWIVVLPSTGAAGVVSVEAQLVFPFGTDTADTDFQHAIITLARTTIGPLLHFVASSEMTYDALVRYSSDVESQQVSIAHIILFLSKVRADAEEIVADEFKMRLEDSIAHTAEGQFLQGLGVSTSPAMDSSFDQDLIAQPGVTGTAVIHFGLSFPFGADLSPYDDELNVVLGRVLALSLPSSFVSGTDYSVTTSSGVDIVNRVTRASVQLVLMSATESFAEDVKERLGSALEIAYASLFPSMTTLRAAGAEIAVLDDDTIEFTPDDWIPCSARFCANNTAAQDYCHSELVCKSLSGLDSIQNCDFLVKPYKICNDTAFTFSCGCELGDVDHEFPAPAATLQAQSLFHIIFSLALCCAVGYRLL